MVYRRARQISVRREPVLEILVAACAKGGIGGAAIAITACPFAQPFARR